MEPNDKRRDPAFHRYRDRSIRRLRRFRFAASRNGKIQIDFRRLRRNQRAPHNKYDKHDKHPQLERRAEYPRDLYKTLIAIADGRKPSGLTAAISELLGKENPRLDIASDSAHATLLVPLEALLTRKALGATSAPAGGFLIANDVGRQIEFALRSASVCIRAGARVLLGLRSDLSLDRETHEVTYDWLAELEEAQLADSEYGAVKLTPHRLAGMTSISTQLNAQAPDVSAFLVESLTRGIGAGQSCKFQKANHRGEWR